MWDVVGSGLLGVLFGLWAGHKLTLIRDIRKEFNEGTEHLRTNLRSHIHNLERRLVMHPLSEKDLEVIVGKLGESRSREIVARFNRYTATVEKCVVHGNPFKEGGVKSPGCWDEMIADARKLYEAVQPK